MQRWRSTPYNRRSMTISEGSEVRAPGSTRRASHRSGAGIHCSIRGEEWRTKCQRTRSGLVLGRRGASEERAQKEGACQRRVIQAVLDVNVLISAAFPNDASPKRLLEAWDRGEFELVVSPALIAELTRVLDRPRILKRLRDGAGADLLAAIAEGEQVDDANRQSRSKDPDDAT